ncbi:MAG: phytanoyl-CoA dioxygenase family protein [Alphaproteobacteria bacterium]
MAMPEEFSTEAVQAASADAFEPYQHFLSSGEPYRSMISSNPWMRPPRAKDPLEWGQGWYYDTTVGRKHPDWKDVALPRATKDLRQLRQDLYTWGYCLIEDGLSAAQCARIHARVVDQAAAERALGIAHVSPEQQHVWSLVNKGPDFPRLLEHDPECVQAGPMIETLLDETLGAGWNHYSFLANISYPDCHPQGLHQDQSAIAPFRSLEAPVLVNTVYILQDVNEHNGGTLIIPGSHRVQAEGAIYGALPRAINLEAPAGSVLIMDGRTLHGGAVNRSGALRYILTNSVVKPWLKQQESFLLGLSPAVLAAASDKFLWRCGFQATSVRNMVEGYGYFGSGQVADPNGSLVHVRRAMDAGGYVHTGSLSMDNLEAVDLAALGLPRIQAAHETYRSENYQTRMAAVASR